MSIRSFRLIAALLPCCAAGCHLLLPLEPAREDTVAPADSTFDRALDVSAPVDVPADVPLDRGPLPDRPPTCAFDPGTTSVAKPCLSASPPKGSLSLWPVAAGAGNGTSVTSCDWIDGVKHPAVGIGAANWFVFGGCGDWKEYEIGPACRLRVMSYSGGCLVEAAAALGEVIGVIEEWDGATWQPLRSINHGLVTNNCSQVFESPTTPITPSFFTKPARVRVRQTGANVSGFLICVYSF